MPLAVDADLQIQDPWGRTLTVVVHDGRGTVVVPRSALRSSSLRALPSDRARWTADVQRVLGTLGVAVDVTCEGHTIARISPTSSGNWLARLFRLGPVNISLRGLLAALLLGR